MGVLQCHHKMHPIYIDDIPVTYTIGGDPESLALSLCDIMAEQRMNPAAFSFAPTRGQHGYGGEFLLKPNDSRSRVKCRFFERGLCRNGNACPYLHENDPASKTLIPSEPNLAKSPMQENATRTINGALVHFEAGAAVKSITLSSDSLTIQINHLPPNSTRDSVLALLHSHGLRTSAELEVRVTNAQGLWSAHVKVNDPEFVKLVGQKLGPQNQTQGSRPTATVVETPISSDSNTLRVDCRKVHLSWHKPTRTVWLNFGNREISERVAKRFKDGTYTLLKQKVQCGSPSGREGRFNPLPWTVCLTEVPASVAESDISQSIYKQADKPRHIELGKPSYTADTETCSATIQSLFTSVGPVEWSEFTLDTTGKRAKASARFHNEEDARTAARTLNYSALPFHKAAKLTVQLVYTAKFKVHANICEAVQPQIKARIRAWKDSHLYFTLYENSIPPKWYRVMKVEGEDVKGVVGAKDDISRILSGIVARDGSTVLWHPALRGNGILLERLKQLEQQLGILIIRSKAKSQLRLYGTQKKCEEGQAAIANLLKDEGSETFSIDLGADELSWALRGGFARIKNGVGSNKANLEIAPTYKRILIIGSLVDYEMALSIMKDRNAPRKESIKSSEKQDCSFCYIEAEDPIETHCSHVYCLDCFENYCVSAIAQNETTRLECIGESGICGEALRLSEIQEHLPSAAFEELLEQSLASYIRTHPQSFKQCPSVDCGYIYRTGPTPRMHTCPNCLTPVCIACHAQHGEMTCAEYKDVSSGGYEALNRYKKEQNIKDCPKCSTPLDKIAGCNHMVCHCGAHICWACLETFKVSDDCYDHMNKVHRDIGLNYLRDRFGDLRFR
ncbi:uncharacterized protein F4822DRAFT_351369 [Hypoxylon trugodes]|uniref:uncharacterized protein n=1 Tax=Hypoxylon trugodes TaxID=326681 RepID=UPI00219AC1D9|nr:uncharacterized protein F4822DRAFT_351369 [Hypoxylon trugodes]KAI1385689.1 hypothetical protein F4822DRAFT_351369 [Hypoxylon trugodes]